jgi:hypothetical protein
MFQGSVFGISLLIGFIAGALAIIGITDSVEGTKLSKQIIVTLLGAGYAGTDFIEGFIKKYLPANRKDEQGSGSIDEINEPAMG